jgi:hypothetical protein
MAFQQPNPFATKVSRSLQFGWRAFTVLWEWRGDHEDAIAVSGGQIEGYRLGRTSG